ncbi:MAG: hypothetical protein IPK64_03555 [bacterium]|nr:hypothetical protein [bacterium]
MNDASTDPAAAPEFRLDVGGAVIALRCPQVGLAEGLAAWFGLASSPLPAAVSLEVEVVAHDDAPGYPRSLLTSKRLLAPGTGEAAAPGAPPSAQPFDIADGLLRGWYDAATGTGAVRVKAALLAGHHTRIFEQLLYQAHRSAVQKLERTAWLVHSSAVIAGGQGFLFVGPSGAGKSTVARLSAAHHVLGDEMNLLLPRPGGGWDVAGTPFNGLFRAKRPGRAPLRAVLLLEHGPQPSLREAPLAESVAALAGEIVPPVGLDQAPGPDTLPAMVGAAHEVAAHTALKVLAFAPDAGFWITLDQAFGTGGTITDSNPGERR